MTLPAYDIDPRELSLSLISDLYREVEMGDWVMAAGMADSIVDLIDELDRPG